MSRDVALKYFKTWSCEAAGEPLFTQSSLLWPATRWGKQVMLKIVMPDDDEAHAAEALDFFAGHGSVELFEHDQNVLLLERVIPACDRDLKRMVLDGRDDDATRIICDVIEKLHSASKTKPAPTTAIPFRQRSFSLRTYIDEGRTKANERPMFKLAGEILEDLIKETAGSEIFLHGDIHHFNILQSSERGWLAIDPKGIQGPRIYEYANSLCNPYMHESVVANTARMKRQASIISETARLDMNLLIQFTFVHAMQAAAWNMFESDQGYWLACAKTAANLAGFEVD